MYVGLSGGYFVGRDGDCAEWHNAVDRLLGAQFRGGLRTVCEQGGSGAGAAETQGKNRTQVG